MLHYYNNKGHNKIKDKDVQYLSSYIAFHVNLFMCFALYTLPGEMSKCPVKKYCYMHQFIFSSPAK